MPPWREGLFLYTAGTSMRYRRCSEGTREGVPGEGTPYSGSSPSYSVLYWPRPGLWPYLDQYHT